jgi:hypothetical protein
MEQHPVPQNVTTFQFRLIGDMTIKQFGYLAGGAILGYIFYKLPFPIFISLPAGVGVFLLGFGFAFVPVEERPMDVWFFSFIKSIYNPTLYVWQREKTVLEPEPKAQPAPGIPKPTAAVAKSRPPAVPPMPQTGTKVQPAHPIPATVAQMHAPAPQPAVPNRPASAPPPMIHTTVTKSAKPGLFDWFKKLFTLSRTATPKPAAPASMPPVAPAMPQVHTQYHTPSVTGTRLNVSGQTVASAPIGIAAAQTTSQPNQAELTQANATIAQASVRSAQLEEKLVGLQQELQQKTASEARIVELQKQLSELMTERQTMQSELSALRARMEKQQAAPPAPTKTAGYTQEVAQPTVKVISPDNAVRAGLPKLTTFPNVVTGIIKDNEGNLLPGVLVTVRDKDDIPVRALKTNKLGQFAASTPLPDNTYVVEVEDPRNRYVFDRVQITLGGKVVPAIEVIAKSQKELSRAQLAKEIFGNQPM